MELDTVLVTQARIGSTRLPGKVLKKVNDEELLKIHLRRLNKCLQVDEIIVATTVKPADDQIADLAEEWNFKCFRGSEDDVLDRYYQAVKSLNPAPRWVVRVTSDCPLLDPMLVDEVIQFAKKADVDYVSNTIFEHYPDGQDVEVFRFAALEKAWTEAEKKSEREHVTPFIKNNSDLKGQDLFTARAFPSSGDYSEIRMTVDEPEDFALISKLIKELGTDKNWLTYTQYIIDHNLSAINGAITRNSGYIKSLNQDNNE